MLSKKILIIDDKAAVRDTIRKSLKDEGYELLFAENGKEGLQVYNEHHPALIILDLKMPLMDGVEFLEHIKLSPSNPCSIIVLTGHGADEDVEKCFNLGVSAFLRKPFNFYELNGMVKHSITLKQDEEDLKKHRERLEELVDERTLELRQEITERKRIEEVLRVNAEQLSKINTTFLKFKSDYTKNIKNLTALTGQLLGGSCALYNRLDEGMLCSTGLWNTPPDYNPIDKPDGHICYDVIKQGGNEVFIVRDLQNSSYAKTDPYVALYKLQTYIGHAVKCGMDYVGSLCVVYQEDVVPSEEHKKILGIIASAIGIEEERKQSEENLRLFRNLINHSNDAIFVIEPATSRFLDVNDKSCSSLGYLRKELLGMCVVDVQTVIPDNLAWGKFLKEVRKKGFMVMEGTHKRKDGTTFPIEASIKYIVDGNKEYIVAVIRDIAERKRLEIARDQFSKKLVESQEKERKRIASEIHDGLGQNILVIKSGIRKCLKSLSGNGKVIDTLNRLSSISQQSIDEVREIISNLHPHQLDQLGLKGAVESAINQAKQSSEIRFYINIKDIDGLLPKNNEIHLYRILQEGLSNIVKHSGATKSKIYIGMTKDSLNIKIMDNGKGFVFNSDNISEKGFGLIGISERVKMLEGNLKVDSLPGEGTTLTIKVPVKKKFKIRIIQ